MKKKKQKSYLTWLHELTVLGYQKNIVINSNHSDWIDEMYKSNMTPESALTEYQQLLTEDWKL